MAGSVCLPVSGYLLSLSGSLLEVTDPSSNGLIEVNTSDKKIPWFCSDSLMGLDV